VGPSNLFTLLESIPPYWESIRELFHNRMGDPDTPEGQDVLKAASPFFHAKNIKAPLLVGQGANDPRVKKAESDQIVVAMRDLGLPVEYLNFPDEGHGFANPDNSMAFFAQTEKFLAGHLGGRYQEDVPDNLQEIIENVTVDISTVKLPEKITEESANAALPMPDKAPEVGTTKYDVTIKMGQEEIKMDMSSTVEDGGDHWILTDASTSEMGDMTDIAKLKKGSLVAMSRTLTRGPMIVTIDHDEAAITGNVAMSGRDIGIDVPYENDVFGHGTALGVTLAQLPLAEGYTTTYRTFNPTSQKVSNYKLTVTGSEPVITPKGKKDSYHLLLEALDGSGSKTNMWMSKDDNPKMLKMKMSILEMGGAKMTVMIK